MSISIRHRSGTTLGRDPPSITPTFTVTPGHRPLRSCRDRIRCAAARIALRPRSGSTPAWALRPTTSIGPPVVPLRAETIAPVSRAHSRTNATSRPSATSRITDPENVEPISSSGLHTKAISPNRSHPDSSRISRAWNPASRPAFMSHTPGPNARSPSTRYGRAAAVPSGKTVSMWPIST